MRSDGSEVYHGPADLNATGGLDRIERGPTTRGGEKSRLGNFTGLTNLASSAIADHDVVPIQDRSDTDDSIKGITFGEIAAKLADGTTITSNAGVLSAVGGGGGTGDNTLGVLTESLDGDGTADLALVTPLAGDAANQDYMLIYDRSMAGLRRTGLGDLAAQISANPFQGTTTYTGTIAPGDFVLFRDISLGVNHALTAEELYEGAFDIAGLHQTAPADDDQIIIWDVSSQILRHVEWDQFNQGGGGGTADGVVTGGSVSGTTLTLERSVGADVTITGLPSGGGGGTPGTPVEVFAPTALSGGETITELTLTEDIARGYWYAFITQAAADTVEAVEYISTDDILDATVTYSDASPPTETSDGGYTVQIPTPNNVGFRHDTLSVWRSDEGNKIWVQHSGRNEALTLRINQIPRGGGSGGGTGTGGIRVEEGGTERIASADALNFDTDDFDIGIIQTPEAAISIAPGGIDEAQLDIGDDPNTAEVLGWDGAGMVWRSPSIEIQHNGTEVNTAAAFINFIGGTVANEVLGVNVTIPAGGGGEAGDPFDGLGISHDAPDAAADLMLWRDTSASTNRAYDFEFLQTNVFNLDIHDDVTTSGIVRQDSRLIFAAEHEAGDPTRYITMGDFIDDHFQILQGRTQVTAIADADQFMMWDVSGTQAREVEASVMRTAFLPPLATTTTPGRVEIATQAEVNSASPDDERTVTPATLQGHITALRSDAAINYTTPANESVLTLASRQSIAEALNAVAGTIPTDVGTNVVANPGGTGLNRLSTVTIGTETFQIEGDDVELGYQETQVTSARNFITLNSVGHAIVPAFAGLQSGITAANLEDTDEMIIGNSGSAFAPHSTTLGDLRTFLGTGGGGLGTMLGTYTKDTGGCRGTNAGQFDGTGLTLPAGATMITIEAWLDTGGNSGDVFQTFRAEALRALPDGTADADYDITGADRTALRFPWAANRAMIVGLTATDEILFASSDNNATGCTATIWTQ